MKLTKAMVLKGTKFTKKIEVEEYGGAEVEIRPLTDIQLTEVMAEEGTLESVLKNSKTIKSIRAKKGKGKLSAEETEELAAQLVEEGVAEDSTVEGAMKMTRKACSYGIVDDELRSVLTELGQGATMSIGMAIIDISTGNTEEVMDFIGAQTDN